MYPENAPEDPAIARPATVTGIILAGGRGRRMQGRDKGLVAWRGQPMAAHVAARLRPLVGELIISCNRNEDQYRQIADHVITDERIGYQGPLAGLESVAAMVSTPVLLVAPCDMPELPGEVFRQLLRSLANEGGPARDAAFLRSGGRSHYLCMALQGSALGSVTTFLDSGGRSVHGWLATLDTGMLRLDLAGGMVSNLNEAPAAD